MDGRCLHIVLNLVNQLSLHKQFKTINSLTDKWNYIIHTVVYSRDWSHTVSLLFDYSEPFYHYHIMGWGGGHNYLEICVFT